MEKRKGLLSVVVLSLALGGGFGCADDSDNSTDNETNNPGDGDGTGDEGESGSSDIVDTAVNAGSFNTLASALEKAGLVEALKGKGPFTVFAPTDAAFEKLGSSVLNSLTKEQLADILTYHVISGEVRSTDLKSAPVSMLNGISAFVNLESGAKINNAKITTADIGASNGVIHVIDTVILPPNLVEAAQFAGSFSTLVGAVQTAGLVDALSGKGPLTVFAPTDAAFAALPAGTLEAMDKATLTKVLTYHVVAGEVLSTDLKSGPVATLEGENVKVDLTNGVRINDASVMLADIVTTNGVIHVIDKVLVPTL